MKLHLGCGSVNLEGWVNIDLESPAADMHLDLRKTLPFSDGSVDYVFAEHFIEHVERHEALRLLQDLVRVLAPGGVIRLATPDLRFLAATYLAGNLDEWGDLWRPDNAANLLNGGMRLWGHQFVYDAEDLEALLFEAGLTRRNFQPWRESAHVALKGLETRPFHQDLIIEGTKPRSGEAIEPFVYQRIGEEVWLDKLQRAERGYTLKLESELARKEKAMAELAAQLAALRKKWWNPIALFAGRRGENG